MGTASSVKSDIASQKDPQRINVLFVCGEWNSSKGGLATFNRQSAINLAKAASDKIKVFCYVSQSNKGERKDAKEHGVHMITARSIPRISDPLEWLRVPPPQLLHPDVVVGHGLKFGIPACCIARATSCKWVHFAHVLYEDLGKYKLTGEKAASSPDTIEENEKKHKEEIELCKEANAVIAVGSRLQQRYRKCLPGIEVGVITPGILETFCHLSDQKEMHSSDEFSIFVFGRASYEDLALKGYDIIADAVGSLGEKFRITFVGAPEGQHRNMEEWFLQKTRITRKQLTIRSYCNQEELKRMFFAADMVAMPSRTEGFGLVALEAMSAGIPLLVTTESGIANALERVEGGKSVIVESEKAEEWAQKIKILSEEKPEERHKSAISLRENYNITYSWSSQCQRFKEKLVVLMNESCPANQVDACPVDQSAGHDSSSVNTVSQVPQCTLRNGGCSEDYSVKHANSIDKKIEQSLGNKGSTLLHSAAQSGNVDTIETILSLGLDIDSRNASGLTPLMVAAFSGRADAFHFLLERGSDPTLKSNNGRSVLHCAGEGGSKVVIEKLLSLGVDIDSRDGRGLTPLMVAAFTGQADAFHFLLERGSDPTLKSNNGRSVLHHAGGGGSKVIIEKLLSLELDIDSRDSDGLTPLMFAAFTGRADAFHFLLERGSDPTLKSNNGKSVLHHAGQGGSKVIIEKLLSLELDIDSRDSDGLTPLMFAAFTGRADAFHFLLERGSDPTLKSNNGKSVLHHAGQGGSKVIIEKLLSLELDIDSRDSDGLTPLMVAAFNGRADAFHFLLERGSDPTLKSNNGSSVLHHAGQGGSKVIIEKLLSLGLDIDSRNGGGLTPLMVAAFNGQADACHFLLERGSDPTLKSNNGKSVLHYAGQGGSKVIIEKLLSLELHIDSRNASELTPLMVAAFNGRADAFHFLLERGSDPSLKDNDGRSVLHHAGQGGSKVIIEKLLSLELHIDSRNASELTPLMVAAFNGRADAFHFLLERGSDPSLKDNDGRSVLHHAGQGGSKVIIEKLLSLGLDIDSRDGRGLTPLMFAAFTGRADAFHFLLERGSDPTLKSNNGRSVLHHAGGGGSKVIIEKLLSLELDIDSRDSDGLTPLMFAAFTGRADAFHFLLERGSDPTLKSNNGKSVLHHAGQGGSKVIIEKLLSLELDIDSRDSDGLTPLMVAAFNGRADAFHFLLERGSDPTLKSNNGKSVLHHAGQGGSKVIIEKLLSLELDIDSRDSDGLTPLMVAAFTGRADAFHFLLERGSDPTLKSNNGRSVLHHAGKGGSKVIIEKLLSLEIHIDSRDRAGETPLVIAVRAGKSEAVNYFLSKGARA